MIAGIKTGEDYSPDAGPPGKKARADFESAPCRDEIHRQQNESHHIKNGGAIADESEYRRKHHVKQRHMIVEHVAILNESACPGPDYVKMLRFIAVEPVVQDIYDPDHDHQREENCCGDEFARTGHFEISRAAPRKRYVLQSCRCCLLERHVEMKAGVP